jgi:hypothetical protein
MCTFNREGTKENFAIFKSKGQQQVQWGVVSKNK